MGNMKIGILGSGPVGQSLAAGFVKYCHEVMIGTGNPSKLNEWKQKQNIEIKVGTFQETATFGDIIVIALKGSAALGVIQGLSPESLSNKTIIDTTNPIADVPPVNGVINFFTPSNKSLMEELQESVPDAFFVKAFNSIGSAHMVNPEFKGGKPTMFICGNNTEAKKEVTTILTLFGWDVEDMGLEEAARAIEPLCILWCIPGFKNNEWDHAFRLLKK